MRQSAGVDRQTRRAALIAVLGGAERHGVVERRTCPVISLWDDTVGPLLVSEQHAHLLAGRRVL
ncbi:MAG: hypothetical protein M3445_06270, partial [Actinomycetota bacterium]|nr:hypothetical protein [Actinomycetota bacterium]